ncbi:putative Histidine kinase [Pseudodesulfovibrio profundus]|uniref:histidine kinase n=1 Tax=Pseudodesulfovibrio profundus TaxID=57320 RepID=A0A2C8FAB4_9BACT|nr:ATP-binding protein [Pseudodesulfovibrio profundus]SOB59585.1 putative Histidine kinase [Pseudodesulfovibrio profundus]
MISLLKKSLILKFSVVVVLVEIAVLAPLGLFYIDRFSSQVDAFLEETIKMPGELMNHQLLRYESVADLKVMNKLVGETFLDGMVIGTDGRIYYSLHQENVGKSLFDLPNIESELKSNLNTESLIIFRPSTTTIASITPLVAYEGAKPFFIVYIKSSTTESQARKGRIAAMFILGSLACITLTSLFIIGYSRRHLTNPINHLKEATDSVRRGDYDVEFPVQRIDEIGSLANGFSAMQQAINRNIDELTQAYADISIKEQKQTALIEAMPDLVLILDKDGTYQEIHAPEHNVLYEDIENLRGKRLHDVMDTKTADRFFLVNETCMRTGTVQTIEYDMNVLSGHRWFEARISPIGKTSQYQGAVWLIRDITYRKEMEETLTKAKEDTEKVNQQLRELDRTKSALVSSVSHELRTPLTSLLGFSKLILKNFANNFWPLAKGNPKLLTKGAQIVENLNILIHEGNRLTRLINDVLDLNKIEMGYTEWRDEPINAATLARNATNAVKGQFEEHPTIDLVTNTSSNLPDIVVDADRMTQVLLNLLTNAAKFTARGSVTFSTYVTEAGMLRFEVKDTGPGIDTLEQDRIFDVFHQAGNTGPSDSKPHGAGLGLAISREIVKHYNGTIWVESEPGNGATFIIELPL